MCDDQGAIAGSHLSSGCVVGMGKTVPLRRAREHADSPAHGYRTTTDQWRHAVHLPTCPDSTQPHAMSESQQKLTWSGQGQTCTRFITINAGDGNSLHAPRSSSHVVPDREEEHRVGEHVVRKRALRRYSRKVLVARVDLHAQADCVVGLAVLGCGGERRGREGRVNAASASATAAAASMAASKLRSPSPSQGLPQRAHARPLPQRAHPSARRTRASTAHPRGTS